MPEPLPLVLYVLQQVGTPSWNSTELNNQIDRHKSTCLALCSRGQRVVAGTAARRYGDSHSSIAWMAPWHPPQAGTKHTWSLEAPACTARKPPIRSLVPRLPSIPSLLSLSFYASFSALLYLGMLCSIASLSLS